VEAANRVFNALLQVRREAVGGRLFICDATMWSLAFGGLKSLKAFCSNLARLPVISGFSGGFGDPRTAGDSFGDASGGDNDEQE